MLKKTKDAGVRIVLFSVIFNAFLFLLKFTVGILAMSTALQADAINSAGDTMSSLAVFFGLKYSIKPSDKEHHYGHGKMEALVSLFVGIVIIISAVFLWNSIIHIVVTKDFLETNIWAFLVAVIAIIIKIFMYFRTLRVGIKLNSIAVQTNAKDHKNDVFATSATAIAILLTLISRMTDINLFRYAEPLAAAIMSIFIIKTGIEIIISSSKMLLDAAPDGKIVEELKAFVLISNGIEKLNWLKCRTSGRYLFVDLAVEVDSKLTVEQGHMIADNIKENILAEFKTVTDVLVHINLYNA